VKTTSAPEGYEGELDTGPNPDLEHAAARRPDDPFPEWDEILMAHRQPIPLQILSLLSRHCLSRDLPKSKNGYRIMPVRRVLTVLLLAVLVVQLGPACGFENAAAMDSMQCCQSKCPAPSSQMPANCCRISASSDKAKPAIGTAPQPLLVYMIGHLAPLALHKISDLSLVTYRSPAPPPERMRLNLFCSRQI
jgi:hypothetical protein